MVTLILIIGLTIWAFVVAIIFAVQLCKEGESDKIKYPLAGGSFAFIISLIVVFILLAYGTIGVLDAMGLGCVSAIFGCEFFSAIALFLTFHQSI